MNHKDTCNVIFFIMNILRFAAPNIISLLSVASAVVAIKESIFGNFSLSVSMIFISVIMDFLDGMVARKLNATSIFGAQIDSLCDSFSFGVAPAMCLYFWLFADFGNLGWLAILVIIFAMILRLARFNTFEIKNIKVYAGIDLKKYFIGIPAPMFGILCMAPIASFNLIDSHLCNDFFSPDGDNCRYSIQAIGGDVFFKFCILFYCIGISILAVSRVRVIALKSLPIMKNPFFLIAAMLFVIASIVNPNIFCLISSAAFLLLFVYSVIDFRFNK